jgi:hypothetical protein
MSSIPRQLALLTIAAAAALVAACGGDDGGSESGVGTGGSGYAVGTVTGFGSVIIDGRAWNDSGARVQVENNPATGPVATTARLGQRVQIEYETEPDAKVVEIGAAAIGTVQAVDTSVTPPLLRVAGQIVQLNFDFDAGPVTLFEGYASAAAISPGDIVEVHGTPVPTGASYVLQASRIEKLTALPAGLVRVQNVVQQFNAAARTMRLGDITVSTAAASVLPTGATIANGRTVTVWARPPAGAGTILAADFVRVRDLSANTKPSDLSGTVTSLDAAARTFDLAGVRVNAATAIVVPANLALANGNFVVVRGSFRSDGSLIATQVRIRRKGTTPGFDYEVSLTGPISDFVSLADFRVRGVRVDASGATQRACAGNNVIIGNGLNVEIGGAIVGDKVVADLLFCR